MKFGVRKLIHTHSMLLINTNTEIQLGVIFGVDLGVILEVILGVTLGVILEVIFEVAEVPPPPLKSQTQHFVHIKCNVCPQ